MERQHSTSDEMPALAHRRVLAWRLYERAARLLQAAEQPESDPTAPGRQPAAVLCTTAACLQILAARLEMPAPAPVPVPIGRPRPRRSA